MGLTFSLVDDKFIEIKYGNKVVGKIFTPAGTTKDVVNAIQVCGFNSCYDLWGCGVFADGKGNAKQDIQLLFNPDSENRASDWGNRISFRRSCMKCFYLKEKCKCKELRIKTKKELIIEGLLPKENGK